MGKPRDCDAGSFSLVQFEGGGADRIVPICFCLPTILRHVAHLQSVRSSAILGLPNSSTAGCVATASSTFGPEMSQPELTIMSSLRARCQK
jgi:hypothetical protein